MITEILIHAHAGTEPILERHMPLWNAHGLPITVMCPDDSAPNVWQYPLVRFGYAAPIGPKAYQRWIEALRWMSRRQSDRFIIFEYDAFCLEPEIKTTLGLTGVMHLDPQGCWVAHRYPGHPMSIDRLSATRLLAHAEAYPDMQEGGYVDRLYAALATIAGVPMSPWRPAGFCMNTISDEDIPRLQACIRAGGRMIHGVKTQRVLDACLEAMK